jgi:hypothetical protein
MFGQDELKVTSKDLPCLRTLSAMSSNTLPPCITMTLLAISSALYAAASFWTASARSRCTRIALMATFLPPPMLPEPSSPKLWAVGQVPLLPPRMEPRAARDNPEDARTDSSAASSIRRRIIATLRNTPGSMGGGVGLPGIGKRGGIQAAVYDEDKGLKLRRGESGGVWSGGLWSPLSISRGQGSARAWRAECGECAVRDECRVCKGGFALESAAGSVLRTRRDSSNSSGSWSHGP